jgi:hypothetical protein
MIRLGQDSLFSESDLARGAEISDAVEELRTSGGVEERGAVFTAHEVVNAILDLCDYSVESDLSTKRLMEPSFGGGDFLLPAIDRLLDSVEERGSDLGSELSKLTECVRAVELHEPTFSETRDRTKTLLLSRGLSGDQADELLDAWLINDDYLLRGALGKFDVVVGNPPYVRQERIPNVLLSVYRERFNTFVNRADLYVLFYERGLLSLADGGRLGFICANRWVRNQYGGALRELIGRYFHLEYFVDLERANAFKSDVIAYPAITVIRRAPGAPTVLATGSRDSADGLDDLIPKLKKHARNKIPNGSDISRVNIVQANREPWLLDAPGVVGHLRDLEERFPPLEEAGANVTIGVATGADRVFIAPFDELPVEDSRKLPLALASDCIDGRVEWGGKGIVNPFLDDGTLAPLHEFPQFRAYLKQHEADLRRRHVARKNPSRWYKTIDRIYPELTGAPKLLIPDIKGDAAVTYDPGEFYPHHNLYVVTGTSWDVLALKTLLRSSLALAFVAAYSPRMAGGFLRFQAQYLRRIRCPRWEAISNRHRRLLLSSAHESSAICDEAVFEVLGIRSAAATALQEYAAGSRVGASV